MNAQPLSPEELAAERRACLERRRKTMEDAAPASAPRHIRRPGNFGDFCTAPRKGVRDDDYVPPVDLAAAGMRGKRRY